MHEFWKSSGYRLLARDEAGRLLPTDDFLRAYLRRPELTPPAEACAAERALHGLLLAEPRREVTEPELAELADADARDNWRVWLGFRDRLLAAGSIDACYAGLFVEGAVGIAPLFVDQMAQLLVRHLLEGCEDPFRVRAGELLFRAQKVSTEGGRVMLADDEVVELHAGSGGFGDIGRLILEAQTALRQVELSVMTPESAARYWARDERHDLVLDITGGEPGLEALCKLLEDWVAHLLEVRVRISPMRSIQDERWSWHLGLTAEATAILNELWHGKDLDEARLARIVALFRLEFADPSAMLPEVAGRPVYMALAMDGAQRVRLKPQNLLTNLPLPRLA
jgi:hypothetical protein